MTGKSTTSSVVLDTSVVAKGLLAPPRHLRRDVYERELETRRKIRVILRLLEEAGVKVFFPRAGTVEVASVLRRSGLPENFVADVVESLKSTFVVVGEELLYEKALEVALKTAPSGFDAYFIALALLTRSLLITDDRGMAGHARRLGLDIILVRETSMEEITARLG